MPRLRATALPLVALLSLSCLLPITGRAFQPSAHGHLENFDRRSAAAHRHAEPEHRVAVEQLRKLTPDALVSLDASPGSPLWVRSGRGFLTGRDGEGRAVPPAAARRHGANDPARGVKAFLDEHRALFGHGSEALATARVRREFTTQHLNEFKLIF